MNKTYRKNILRQVRGTRNRFLAIFAIVALGVSLLVGLVQTAPDMRAAGDRYYDESNLMDVRVISTLGLTDDDLEEIAAIEGVQEVMAVYSADCLLEDEKGDVLAVRMESMPQEPSLNQLQLLEGRMPQADDECVVHAMEMGSTVQVGDVLTVDEGQEDLSLAADSFTVVGIVRTPTNFSADDETVTVGDGKADLLAYLPESAFDTDIYSTIYLTVEGAAALDTYSDEYQAVIDPVTERLEELGEVRSEVRREQVVDDAQAELDDARAEYESQKAEAEAKLADAEAKLASARAEIESGQAEIDDGEAQWQAGAEELAESKRELSQMLSDKQKQLSDARRQLSSGKRQLEAAEKQLDSYQKQYDQAVAAQQQVEEGRQQLEQAKAGLELAKQALAAAQESLPRLQQAVEAADDAAEAARLRSEAAQSSYDQVLADPDVQAGLALKAGLDAVLAEYPEYGSIDELLADPPADMDAARLAQIRADNAAYQAAQSRVDAAAAERDAAARQLELAESAASSAHSLYDQTVASIDEYTQLVSEAETTVAEQEKQLEEAEKLLEQYADLIAEAPAKLEEGRREIEKQRAVLEEAELAIRDGEEQLSLAPLQAQVEFESAQQKLDDSRAQLDAAQAELDEGKAELEEGQAEYDRQKADAEKQLNEAADRLDDAQREIDKINSCQWYVLDRDSTTSVVTFESNADKLASIARVFPVFFFLVAALVALTTMTRMVDENRTQIGTLKALGYSEMAITAKYLLYALSATLLGSAAGLLIGFTFFPSVIWYAYSIMYSLPDFPLLFNWPLALGAVAAATLCTGAATVNACHSTLHEKPAALMVARAPQAGKRIFLEYIRPVWRRMKFTHKVTARNLFRYKKRLVMTVTGIAGCTALLLVGFGIQDSVMDLMDTQYKELWHYDLSVTMSGPEGVDGRRGIADTLNGDRIEDWMQLYQENVTLVTDEGEQSVTLTVPADSGQFGEYVTLRTRRGHDELALQPEGAILTEKAAELLGVSAGGSLTLRTDSGEYTVAVTGVTENYLGGCLYMPAELWQQLTGAEPAWNTVFARSLCESAEERSEMSTTLLESPDVQAASFSEDSSRVFSDTLSNINYVVIVIILCAGLLAVVVLYNLININIGERKKELATIKVLGFYEREVSRYIFREIDLLSVLGGLVGLVLGVPLHNFVIRTVEVEQMMFIRQVDPSSYLYSFGLTMLFTVLVTLLMRRTIRHISMVESMKAPE
ncbi:MAG TPA: FtsX-like permease family protein [Candidatus Anaerofilum faecale]|nr:FtsX-like permease family protein [Candidatus Anaerofilum faecale]